MSGSLGGGGVFGAIEVDVFLGEVASVDGVGGFAEIEVDGDAEFGFGDGAAEEFDEELEVGLRLADAVERVEEELRFFAGVF